MCGSPPDAPQLPNYPDFTPQQQTNIGQQTGVSSQFGGVIGGTSQQLLQNQNILQQISGLFNQDGTINQNAVAQLRQMSSQASQSAGQVGQQALGGIGGTNAALGATQQAYTQALAGNAPANKQLEFTQQQNFNIMKEQAAQQGINIQGDNWANAISNSTAGQKLIQNYQQNANIQNQNYQLGYLGQLGSNMGQLAGAAGQQANTGMGLAGYSQQTPLGYVGQSISGGQSALAPLLSQYQNQLTSAYQPLYMQQANTYAAQTAQQMAQYQAGLNQYNAGQNQMMGWANLAMQGIGAGTSAYSANQNKQGMMALAAA